MLRRLKKSFVTVTMLSAALVLVVLMGIVNLTNYLERADYDVELLDYIAENGGHFPGDDAGRGFVLSATGEMNEALRDVSGEPEPAAPAGKGGRRHGFTEETQYETRYFSVMLSSSGGLVYANTAQIAAVSGEEAVSIAQGLMAQGRGSGRYGSYRYTTVTYGNGDVLYVFLDCTRNFSAVREFFLNSVVVTCAGLAVLFVLAWLLAGRAVRPMVESYEKQKSFITNAGHELKTPLAVIESSTEVIELTGGESQWTQSIHSQVGRLTRLTEELIALARMDEGAEALTLAETDVSALAADCVEPFAMLAEQKGLGFAVDIQPDVVWKVNADALEKILTIMADNAVKYAAGDITFTLRRDGGHVVLREENPAEGLAAGKQEKLFDRFYRADASHSSAQPGYGLGLPLARSLAEAMGGRMQAHSPDGKRLVVTVQL